MSNVVRTLEAGAIQTMHQTGVALPLVENTTLNQKYGVAPALDIVAGDKFSFNYVAIGNGGHDTLVGKNGFKKWEAIPHLPNHAALYNGLPFIVRPETNDLTPDKRVNYRMRRVFEIPNLGRFVGYYLRVVDKSLATITREERRTLDGNTTAVPYVPDLNALNPQRPLLNVGEALVAAGDYMAVSCKMPFTMTTDEIDEFREACKLLYGDHGYAVISEMALVNGVDRTVKVAHLNGELTYTEAVRATVTAFTKSAIVADYFRNGISMVMDVGAAEPLLTVQIEKP